MKVMKRTQTLVDKAAARSRDQQAKYKHYHECLAARGVYDNTPGRPFQIMVANLSGSPTHLPKRMNIALAQDVPDMIVAADTITDTIKPANQQAKKDKRDVEGDVHPQEGG